MARASSKSTTTQDKHDFVSPDTLKFDVNNPRFIDQDFRNDQDIIEYLYDNFDVNELIQSILSAGYIDYEPLIVLRDENIVLEGNRRLAALRLLTDDKIRNSLNIRLPEFDDRRPPPKKIRVGWVNSRKEARDFIGFKHINGPFKWDALAKAKYAAAWLEDDGEISAISRTLGDNHNTVRRLVNGWFVLQQAIEDGFDPDKISKKKFSFSHLYTALTRASVREFLGLSLEDLSAAPKKKSIDAGHIENLQTLMSWLYGQEHKGEHTLIGSQNPNLNQLSEVLGNSEAKQMLMANRDLQVAFERVEPPSARFSEALLRAAKQCEDAMSLSGSYDGDSTLLRVAEGLNNTTDGMLLVMRGKLEKNRDEQ